jgi:hypothetical protein
MDRFLQLGLLLSGALTLGGCVDRYAPDVPAAAQSNLVVDGFINPQGSTVIKLARTFSVNTKNVGPVEARARVIIQDDAGQRYPLAESPAGTYTSAALMLALGRQYQLRISTAQGREYASELAPVVLTPRIDTLTWQVSAQGGAQIYLSTHDMATAARHYRWEYEDTYKATTPYPPTPVKTCWRTAYSTAILQGTTAQLSANTLVDAPLLLEPPSLKLKFGYSLLVRQYAQTQAEYDYWERLRKSSENLGTINDPLPARVVGNVHALADPTEPVLGYVGVHSFTEKRLYIDASQFPAPRPQSVYSATCLGDDSPACTDCARLGTETKPSFWP